MFVLQVVATENPSLPYSHKVCRYQDANSLHLRIHCHTSLRWSPSACFGERVESYREVECAASRKLNIQQDRHSISLRFVYESIDIQMLLRETVTQYLGRGGVRGRVW